jgi:hypothetical protein
MDPIQSLLKRHQERNVIHLQTMPKIKPDLLDQVYFPRKNILLFQSKITIERALMNIRSVANRNFVEARVFKSSIHFLENRLGSNLITCIDSAGTETK